MKLASLKEGGRDGQLIVVSRDLQTYTNAHHIAATMQAALDEWETTAPQLQKLYDDLNNGATQGEPFDARYCAAPLPRAYQWLDGSAYVKHVELVRKARNAELPESFWHDPLMYQGGSDDFLGATDAITFVDPAWGLDYEAEIAVITNDVPLGTSASQAEEHIKLLMLVNDVSLRGLTKDELAKGFGFVQSKPASAFSPVAITPDELGDAWADGKLNLPLVSSINGEEFGRPNAGTDMTFSFHQLVAHAAKTRNLGAGSIIGSGTVANLKENVAEGSDVGSSCLAERRMLDVMAGKEPTPWLKPGDVVKISMKAADGSPLFGTIEQKVEAKQAGTKAA